MTSMYRVDMAQNKTFLVNVIISIFQVDGHKVRMTPQGTGSMLG